MQASLTPLTIEQALRRRRDAAAAAWSLDDTIVLVGAGEPIRRPGRDDLTYPFEPHSEYFYLTDRARPGGVLAFDPATGWVDFVVPITVEDRLWSGAAATGPAGPAVTELPEWLAARRGRRSVWLGSPPAGAAAGAAAGAEPGLTAELRATLSQVRAPKDAIELERMRAAERATAVAFAAVQPALTAGASERAAQIELEAAAFRAGAEAMGYDTIIGGGKNSAVLHFAPTGRRFAAGELVLIDAGAQVAGYVSDITRTYGVDGRLDPLQRELHGVVHAAERAAIERCAPGAQWRDIHRLAALTIAEGLAAAGIVRGAPESLVESGAVWLFFPHGVGHLVGLGVRDAGGALPRRPDPNPYPHLRIDMALEPGMVVTVEPGLYFIPALLADPEHRARHRSQVDWDRVDGLLGFGGIRIEDNVLITDTGHEVITADVPLLG